MVIHFMDIQTGEVYAEATHVKVENGQIVPDYSTPTSAPMATCPHCGSVLPSVTAGSFHDGELCQECKDSGVRNAY